MNRKNARFLIASLAIASLVLVGNQAFAVEDAIDVVPAATLLLPYFEVDLNNPGGRTTLFSVNNASAAPQLAHITFWTDMSRPSLDFTVYLTGYDVMTVNLSDIFFNGNLPTVTGPEIPGVPATATNNVDDTAGDFSIATDPPAEVITTAEDACVFPLPDLPQNFINFIRRVHTGLSAPAGFPEATECNPLATSGGCCGGAQFGDNVARGYITVDVVDECQISVPSDSAYFDEIALTGPEANVLWGDFFLVDPANDFAQGETLVHIENYRFREVIPGDYTFYGRYNAFNAEDNREPLGTTWAVRYVGEGGVFTGGQILCWRDDGTETSATYYRCNNFPIVPPQPLSQSQIVIFDEAENPVTVETPPFSPQPIGEAVVPCPWEANLADTDDFGDIFDFGWLYLNLNSDNDDDQQIEPDILQSWVGTIWSAEGRFSVGFDGTVLNHASDPANLCIGPGRGQVGTCIAD